MHIGLVGRLELMACHTGKKERKKGPEGKGEMFVSTVPWAT